VLRFREDHLRAALGDDARAELFERSKVRQPIRIHDLRASFVTVAFANGRDERWVRDRTGHRAGALDKYARVARTIAELRLGDWTRLDFAIPEFAAAFAAAVRSGGGIRRCSGDRFRQ
jgi:integrase